MYEKRNLTRLTYECGEMRWIWETPHNDASINDIVEQFYTMLVGSTWMPETVCRAMQEFAEERLESLENSDKDNE
jgi:hypothetical protein